VEPELTYRFQTMNLGDGYRSDVSQSL